MARSRRGRAKTRSSPARAKAEPARDPARLEGDALQALETGRHKDAVAACKALLKTASTPAATEAAETLLARAYAGRAAELARKAMFVEALAILEQRAGLAGGGDVVPEEVLWSVRVGRAERAAGLLRERGTELEAAGALPGLRERLAALILAGDGALLAALDPDDALVRDHAASDALLRAFCAGDDAAQDAAAKRIAWRSPYRGLRQLLDAWRRRTDDPAGAADALARLGADSPFGALGQRLAALAALDAEAPIVAQRALHLEPDQRRLAAATLGWPARFERLLADAAAAGGAPDAKARLHLVLGHTDAFDPADARRAVRALSTAASTKPLRAATHRFGAPTRLQRARHEALRAERADELFSTDEAWGEVLDLLPSADDPGFVPGSEAPVAAAESFEGAFLQERDRQLAAALVNRRLADLRARPPFGSPDDPMVIDALWESVALDPHDAAATVRLISTLRESDDLKSARAATDEALEWLPNDTDVLLEAVRTALAGNAYKKAERLAARLLAIDPVNAPVKALMLDAALAHARKQIKTGKLDLARRQLDDVAVRVKGDEARGRIDVLHGLLDMIDGSAGADARGRQRLVAGHDALGGGLIGHFRVSLEAVRLGHDPRRVARWAGLAAPGRLEDDDTRVRDLVRAIGAEREDPETLHHALEPLAKVLRGAAKRRWTIEDVESLCETLLRARQYAILEAFAEVAARRHTQVPAFVYLHECARARGDWHALDGRSLGRLRSAARHAERIGDSRTRVRIDELINPPEVFEGSGAFGGFGDAFGFATRSRTVSTPTSTSMAASMAVRSVAVGAAGKAARDAARVGASSAAPGDALRRTYRPR